MVFVITRQPVSSISTARRNNAQLTKTSDEGTERKILESTEIAFCFHFHPSFHSFGIPMIHLPLCLFLHTYIHTYIHTRTGENISQVLDFVLFCFGCSTQWFGVESQFSAQGLYLSCSGERAGSQPQDHQETPSFGSFNP